jgi:hypothetical protein
MATHNPVLVDGTASETIVKGQFVKYESGGWDACDTQGEHADGVAFSDAQAGEGLAIQIGGLVKYKVGAAPVTDGALLTTGTGGLAEAAGSGDYPRLKAHGAGAAGAYACALWYDGFIYDGT